ncbi:hypothetical protein BU17DRAFT_89092 [Hysterangium stoloniferum]|nr:hypothetical protein BU17DRAFT_89092 [Hysterangium stoloniferum]
MPPKLETHNFLVPSSSKAVRRTLEDSGGALVLRNVKSNEPHASTSRALVLRREAYGSGEIVNTRKISGQEKLKLLANEMMSTAVRSPFRMDELIRMADSQLGVHLGEISNLKDPMFFCDDILATIDSRMESAPGKNNDQRPHLSDARWIAQVIGSRVHNVYFLAGSWKIVRNLLMELQAMHLHDSDVRGQLQHNVKLRERYLVLFQVIIMLARMGQARVAHIAAATPHYAPYFAQNTRAGTMEFDHSGRGNVRKLREAHRSFIDSIVLELALPNSEYPPYILMSLLHDAVEECRKEEKRFSQALWDAVGDFSVTVQVMDILEGPLLGKDGEGWIKTSTSSSEYTEFLSVQEMSSQASKDVEPWKNCLKHLFDMKDKGKLDILWSLINQSYKRASGQNIDELWSLQTDLHFSPQWSMSLRVDLYADDSDVDARAVVLHKKGKKNDDRPEKRLPQIAENEDEYEDIPDLMTASNSSTGSGAESDSAYKVYLDGESESDFGPDEDEALQGDLLDALDAMVDMDLIDSDPDAIQREKKSSNPFTRMFANFKERYFSADPTLRATEKSRNPFKSRPAPTSLPSYPSHPPRTSDTDPDLPPLEPIAPLNPKTPAKSKPYRKAKTVTTEIPESEEELPPLLPLGGSAPQKSQKPTVEEVEDEDNVRQSKKKKKKKKKKARVIQDPQPDIGSAPMEQPTPPPSTHALPQKTPKSSPVVSHRVQKAMEMSDANFSRTSLPLATESVAQSARSYLLAENLMTEKSKVKSRPGFASIFRSGKDKEPKEDGTKEKKGIFGRMKNKLDLGKKTTELMGRLIGPTNGKMHGNKPMKWEEFLKVMQAMGFSYDPSTAGSSVRFDPLNSKDRSITFHKPHPDPTLHRNHLRNFGKKLKERYGWNEKMFKNFGVEKDDSDIDSDY